MKKKIIYIVLFILLILAIIIFFTTQNFNKNEISKNNNSNTTNTINSKKTSTKDDLNQSLENSETVVEDKKVLEKTYKTELEDGTLYSLSNEKNQADVLLGDNYFDTQIRDMNLNPVAYMGKIIEIEGMYMVNLPYTFVGRYSLSNLCPNCPTGYSYMEYTWDGEEIELKDEDSWIKVVGTLEKLNDETTYYQDYYYIKAQSIEVMNESGLKTVSN